MGSFCSCWSRHSKGISLLLVGLDNAGKTTALRGLTGEPADNTVPTIGFSCAMVKSKKSNVKLFDLGGLPNIRGIWDKYFADVHGVIFVVDASQVDRLAECRVELEKLLSHEKIRGKPLLVLANKQDLPGALDELDLVDRLNLEQLVNLYKCPTTVETCAAVLSPDPAIQSGFNWLVATILKDFTVLDSRVSADTAAQQSERARQRQERLERVKELRKERGESEEAAADEPEFDTSPFRPIEEIMSGNQNGTKMILVQQSPPPPEEIPSENVNVAEAVVEPSLTKSTNNLLAENLAPVESRGPKKGLFPSKNNKTAPVADTSPGRKQMTALPPLKMKSPVPTEPSVPWMKPVLSANGDHQGGKERAWDLDQSLDVIQLADVGNGVGASGGASIEQKTALTALKRPKLHNGR